MKAGDVMTRDVVSVGPDTGVSTIVNLLLAHGISGVPVVDADRRVLGIVSEGDLIRRAELGTQKTRGGWARFFTGTATLAEDYVRAHGVKASDIMSTEVVTVTVDTPLTEIADRMEDEHIKRVPVLDGDKLVGIVSRANLLRAFASLAGGPTAPASGTATGDADIREKLHAEIARQPWGLRGDNSVVVTDGVVHLWGLVSTPDEQRALELLAGTVPGVKGIRSHLVILSEQPYPLYPGSMIA
jgi:CBS domain-containing protein